MLGLYILEDGKPKLVDHKVWGKWMCESYDSGARRVDSTVEGSIGEEMHMVRVSTVFLGIDHNFMGVGKPLLWETMIFGGPGEIDQYQNRYTSLASAKVGHWKAVDIVKEALK